MKLVRGDKILARTPASMDENTHKKIGGHVPYGKPLTVIKVFKHGVRTFEKGYIHNNNIIKKVYYREDIIQITPSFGGHGMGTF